MISIRTNIQSSTRTLITMTDYYFPKINYQIPVFPKINYLIPDPYVLESSREPIEVIDKVKPKYFVIKKPKEVKLDYFKSSCVKKPLFIPNMDDIWLKKSMEMMVIWNESVKHVKCLQAINLPSTDNVSKIFVKTLKICRKFLNGNLIKSKEFTPPYNIEPESRRYSVDEFKSGLSVFLIKLPKIHWMHKRKTKMSLVEFLAGEQVYANISSQFFLYFTPDFVGRDTEEMSIMTDRWLLLTGEDEVSMSDKKNFSDYLKWATEHFQTQYKGFRSIRSSFSDWVAAMDFITFGTLRRYNARTPIKSSGILNQDFFKGMMEEFRISHGYTV